MACSSPAGGPLRGGQGNRRRRHVERQRENLERNGLECFAIGTTWSVRVSTTR
jgi:hypothetical protein